MAEETFKAEFELKDGGRARVHWINGPPYLSIHYTSTPNQRQKPKTEEFRLPLRELPGVADRVETGPVQFGTDWPGIFIRGDDCARYIMSLSYLKEHLDKMPTEEDFAAFMGVSMFYGLLCLLDGAIIKHEGEK